MRSFTVAASLLASASTAFASSASVVNHCNFDVYLWSVSATPGSMQTLKANGGSYSEQYQTNSNGGGISIKMSTTNSLYSGNPTQFEYTYTPSGQWAGVAYDISNIDGDPFKGANVNVVPTGSGGSCSTVQCAAGGGCTDVYYQPDNNYAVHTCPIDSSLTYNICAGNSGSSGSAPASSSPAPSPSPSPSSSAKAAPTPPPAPSPSPSPSPSPTTIVTVKSSPSQAAPAPASSVHYAMGLVVGANGKVTEAEVIPPKKRDAEPHADHMERHERIRRMHHARTNA